MALNDWNGTEPEVSFSFNNGSVDVSINWTSPILSSSLSQDGEEVIYSAPLMINREKGRYVMKARQDPYGIRLVYLRIDLEENV